MEANLFPDLVESFSTLPVGTYQSIEHAGRTFDLSIIRTRLSAVLNQVVVPEADETNLELTGKEVLDNKFTYRIRPEYSIDGVAQEAQILLGSTFEEELSIETSTAKQHTHPLKEMQRLLESILSITSN